jgi:hypothetical protein
MFELAKTWLMNALCIGKGLELEKAKKVPIKTYSNKKSRAVF